MILMATQQRPDACRQFRHGERLDHIIVRARIETCDAILDEVTSGQDQYRQPMPFAAYALQDLESTAPWEHQVENQEVEGLLLQEEKSFLAGACRRDAV